MTISVNKRFFENKEEAKEYLDSLEEILAIRIFVGPDLKEGKYGPTLKKVFKFRLAEPENINVFVDSVKAQLRNELISIFGKEYVFLKDNLLVPLKLWEVEVTKEMDDPLDYKFLDFYELVDEVRSILG